MPVKKAKKAVKKKAKKATKKKAVKKAVKKKAVKKKAVKKKAAEPAEEPVPEKEELSEVPKGKIKGIIFDFWGTIVENGVFPSPIRQIYRMLRLNIQFSDFIVPFEETFMLTRYEDLFKAFDAVCAKFGSNPPPFIKERMVGLWNKNKMFAKPYAETIEVLEQLKKDGFKIALISNSDCFSIRELLEKFDLEKHFDVVSLSYEEGMLKSDKKMVGNILKELGLTEDEVLFVGDSVESDVRAAENAGVKPILIDRRNRREFEDKVGDLRDLKDFLE